MRSTLSSFDPTLAGMSGAAQIAALSLHAQAARTPPAPAGFANDGFLAGLRGLAAREASRDASREGRHTHEAVIVATPVKGPIQTSRSVAATRLLVESFA